MPTTPNLATISDIGDSYSDNLTNKQILTLSSQATAGTLVTFEEKLAGGSTVVLGSAQC